MTLISASSLVRPCSSLDLSFAFTLVSSPVSEQLSPSGVARELAVFTCHQFLVRPAHRMGLCGVLPNSLSSMNANLISRDSHGRPNKSTSLNYITAARGHLISTGDTDSYTYGYESLSFWLPSKQAWITSDHDFTITEPDFDSARAIFWDKWTSYVQRRFNLKYVKIENL